MAHLHVSRILLLASTTLAIAPACASEEAIATTGSAITSELPIADINGDGVVDQRDAVFYLKSLGIRFNTYGVTDDQYNPGGRLPRRPHDLNVKEIAPQCLASYGAVEEPFPAENLPGITKLATTLLRLPQHYLRDLGRLGYTFTFAGGLGWFTKSWDGTAGGYPAHFVFYRDANNALAGRVSFDDRAHWEPLDSVRFDPTTKVVSFHRHAADQTYTGTINSDYDGSSHGTSMSGQFTSAGTSTLFSWSATPFYAWGATTGAYGTDTPPSPPVCTSTPGCACTADTVGSVAHNIYFGVGASDWTFSHELGHAVREDILGAKRLYFTDSDLAAWNAAFPDVVDPSITDGRSCGQAGALIGSGFVTPYGAGGREDDFADLQMYSVFDPGYLAQRAADDQACDGNTGVADKVAFYRDYIDTPEPTPAAVVHPVTNQTFRFMTRDVVKYNATAGARGQVPGGLSRTAVSAASNGSDRIWLAMTAKDDHIYYRSYGTGWTGWLALGHHTPMPPALTQHATGGMAVYMVGYDHQLRFQLFDGLTGALGASGVVPGGMTTSRQIAAVTAFGLDWIFAIDDQSHLRYTSYAGAVPPATLVWKDLGKLTRQVSAAVTPIAGTTVITVAAVDDAFHLSTIQLAQTTHGFWAADPQGEILAAAAITPAGQLYLLGFDDSVYTKRVGATTNALVPDL